MGNAREGIGIDSFITRTLPVSTGNQKRGKIWELTFSHRGKAKHNELLTKSADCRSAARISKREEKMDGAYGEVKREDSERGRKRRDENEGEGNRLFAEHRTD